MIADLKPFRQAVIRVTNETGESFFGVGLLLTPDVVVTCAHVVAQALGALDPKIKTAPAGNVFLNLPFVDGGETIIVATTLEEGWFPHSDPNLADIAFLRTNNKLRAPTIRFSIADEIDGCVFKAWVGQEGHETQFIDIKGEIGGEIGNGRYHLDVRNSNYKIEPGCSGAPVADTETGQVLGLIVQEESDKGKESGFLIPASHLRQAASKARIYHEDEDKSPATLNSWVEGRYQQSRLDQKRVIGFISHYVGGLGNPMPFVGREPVLGLLDAWLSQNENRFLLLSGQAGWGKSALLVHWLAQLVVQRPEVTTLFIPISIRFNTSAERDGLRLIHSAFCDVFKGLRFPEDSQPSVEQYRDRLFDAWPRIANRPKQRYLLIVDGIDEAANEWIHKVNHQHELIFPKNLPSNLHILVSVRHKPGQSDGQSWLSDLPIHPASTPLELTTLPKSAITQAIIQLGYPVAKWADNVAFVDELYKLTDRGDPLLLALWIGEIWQHRQQTNLNVPDLRLMKPGLKGFFTYWLGKQEALWQSQESAVQQITFNWLLHVLAFANGPLLLTDLMEVLNSVKLDEPADKLVVYSTLSAGYRLVTNIQQALLNPEKAAFIFVHSRLNDYFKEEIFQNYPGRSYQIELAYITWGKEVVKRLNYNELTAQSCPLYLLHHYTEHLAAIEESIGSSAIRQPVKTGFFFINDQILVTEHWLPLLECGWHQAWECYEGAWGGFLNDLVRIAKAVRRFNQHCWEHGNASDMKLAAELRIKLIHVSILHLERSVPAELMLELVKSGEWTIDRAIRVTEVISDPERRFECFTALESVCTDEKKVRLIADALISAEAIEESRGQAKAFAILAPLVKADEHYAMLRRALDTAIRIEDEKCRAYALNDIAPYLVVSQDLCDEAKAVATNIQGDYLKMLALSGYSIESSKELAIFHKWHRKFDLGWGHSLEAKYAEKLIEDASTFSVDRKRILLRNAFNAIKRIENECEHQCGLMILGGELDDDQDLLMELLETIGKMENPSGRAEAILAILPSIKETGLHQKWILNALDAIPVISMADGIMDPDKTRLEYLTKLAPMLAGDQTLLQKYLDSVRTIIPQNIRKQAIAVFVPYLAGDRNLLNHALNILRLFHDEEARIHALTLLAPHLLGNKTLVSQILETLKSIHDEEVLREGLLTYAEHFCGSDEILDQALKLAKAMKEPFYKMHTLTGFAEHLDADERQRLLTLAQESAYCIKENIDRVTGFSFLAFHVEGENRKALIEELLNIPIESMIWNMQKIASYGRIVPHLHGQQKKMIVQQALNYAKSLDHQCEHAQATLIANLAPYLAEDKAYWKQVMNLITSMHDDDAKHRALLHIAQHLHDMPTLLNQAVQNAWLIKRLKDRTEVLCALAMQMNDHARHKLLEKIRKDVKNTETIYDYFYTVKSLLPCLQNNELIGELGEVLTTLESLEDIPSDFLIALAPHLKGFPDLAARALSIAIKSEPRDGCLVTSASIIKEYPQLMDFAVWVNWIHHRPRQRDELLNTMETFAFGASQLAGIQEVPEIARAILDVGQWWP